MKFDIGDWVFVKAVMKRAKISIEQNSSITIAWKNYALDLPTKGRIVGKARRFNGQIRDTGYGCYMSEDIPERYFAPSKSHLFYKVIFGWLNNPVLVSESDMEPCGADMPTDSFPKLWRAKEIQSKE